MKRYPFYLSMLAGAVALGLSSCLVNHARMYEHAFECDGVLVEEPDKAYSHEGKAYLKGTRINVRLTRDSSYQSFGEIVTGPGRWEYSKIPGTVGKVVYRELTSKENRTEFRRGSTWRELDIPNPEGKKIPAISHATESGIYTMRDTRHLTWRGVYALPAAAALLTVELPYNIVSFLINVIAPH